MHKEKRTRPWLRALLRWGIRIVLAVVIAAAVLFGYFFRTALYHRFYLFPKQAAAWQEFKQQRNDVTLEDGWTEYRGACHTHSHFSHDSEMQFPDILEAAKTAGLDFIFLTDHCVEGKADFSLQWKGLHDGVLFVRGFEMGDGFMPWGLPDSTILDRAKESPALAQEIRSLGGVLFFAHSEEERLWDLPELNGMEIYNIHTDLKDEGRDMAQGLLQLAPDMILSLGVYPDLVLRRIFDRQTKILAHWDELNETRKIVGIAANDSHQNTGFRGYYTAEGAFLLRDTSPNSGKEYPLNPLTRLLLWAVFGKLEPGNQLFRVDLDPYERSLRFVNTHMLARGLTEKDLVDALAQGRVFIAFDMIADARGFTYLAQDATRKAVMGESIAFSPDLTLKAASPVSCRFTLIRDGSPVTQQEGLSFAYVVDRPGKYRVEAELRVVDEWTPWVYTNPIEVTALGPGSLATGAPASLPAA